VPWLKIKPLLRDMMMEVWAQKGQALLRPLDVSAISVLVTYKILEL
jgi:hypothetical protein